MNNNNELLEILELSSMLIRKGIAEEVYKNIALPRMPELLVNKIEEYIKNLKGEQK